MTGRVRAGRAPARIEIVVLTPLAPTKLTNLASELENRRQCRVEPEVDGIRRELVFKPLEPQDVEPREDRDHERLPSIRA